MNEGQRRLQEAFEKAKQHDNLSIIQSEPSTVKALAENRDDKVTNCLFFSS